MVNILIESYLEVGAFIMWRCKDCIETFCILLHSALLQFFYFCFRSRYSEVFSGSVCFYSCKQNKYCSYLNPGSQDGVVSTVTRLWSGIQIQAGEKDIFFFPKCPAWGPTQPPMQWTPGALSTRCKRAGA
jgi:hypothetical protein